jgi:hypothetical protein
MPRVDAATLARPDGANTGTVAEARRALAAKFHAAGLDTPDLDARILVGHALGLDHAALAAAATRGLGADEESGIFALASRRLAGEPVARILGYKEFWSLPLRVDAATSSRPRLRRSMRAARARGSCASPTSAPAAARLFWHCCPNCRTPSASAPTRVLRRLWWRSTMPAASL